MLARLIFTLLGLIIIMVSILGFSKKYSEYVKLYKSDAHIEIASGSISRIEYIKSKQQSSTRLDDTTYTCRVEFTFNVNNDDYYSSMTSYEGATLSQMKSRVGSLKAGSPIEVKYDPSNPEKAIIKDLRLDSIIGATIFSLIFFIFGCVICYMALAR